LTKKLEGKIALVTGASRGIGRAVAKRLAAEGAHVIALARTTGGLEELDDEIQAAGGTTTLVPTDLTQPATLDGLAMPLYERWGRLDILVGNAGILGRLMPLPQFPPDVWEQCFAVNVHANWRLLRALDPLLRAAPAGRAVFVTSGAAQKAPAYWGAYSATKAALEAMVRTYADEVGDVTQVRTNLLSPGPTRTAMRSQAYPTEAPESLKAPEELTDAFLWLCSDACNLNGQVLDVREWSPPQG